MTIVAKNEVVEVVPVDPVAVVSGTPTPEPEAVQEPPTRGKLSVVTITAPLFVSALTVGDVTVTNLGTTIHASGVTRIKEAAKAAGIRLTIEDGK